MASNQCPFYVFPVLLLIALASITSNPFVAEARHLLDITSFPELPMPELPNLPSFSKPELPAIPTLEVPEFPQLPSLPDLPGLFRDIPVPASVKPSESTTTP